MPVSPRSAVDDSYLKVQAGELWSYRREQALGVGAFTAPVALLLGHTAMPL